jgi:hypothetical protein
MEKYAICVSVEHLSLVNGMGIEIIDGFSQTIFGYFYDCICDLRAGHSSSKGGSNIAKGSIHEHLEAGLPFL